MKDAYSFDLDAEASRHAYNKMFVAYLRTYERMELKAIPMQADTGPIGGDMSHEFIILADTGESEVYCHSDYLDFQAPDASINYDEDLSQIIEHWTSRYAATDEKHDPERFDIEVPKDRQISTRGIEVGHIFYFGDKYSKPMGATVMNADGKEVSVQMGSYGIGVSRLVGAVIEASHDDDGIIWPAAVAPFHVGLINLKVGDRACDGIVGEIYQKLSAAGVDVLLDDTEGRAGGKFATLDLIGLPWQIIVGPRGVKAGVVEVKERRTGDRQEVSIDTAIAAVRGV